MFIKINILILLFISILLKFGTFVNCVVKNYDIKSDSEQNNRRIVFAKYLQKVMQTLQSGVHKNRNNKTNYRMYDNRLFIPITNNKGKMANQIKTQRHSLVYQYQPRITFEHGFNAATRLRLLQRDRRRKTVKKVKGLTSQKTFTNCHKIRECEKCKSPCQWRHARGCAGSGGAGYFNTTPYENSVHNYSHCPQILQHDPVLVRSGEETMIRLSLYAPDPSIYEQHITCRISFKDRIIQLKSYIEDNVVVCYPIVLTSGHNQKCSRGVLRVMWGGAQRYSNKIALVLFDCASKTHLMECSHKCLKLLGLKK